MTEFCIFDILENLIQQMKKIILISGLALILSSCVVSTAGKVVKTAVRTTTKVVKGTVKGVSWAVKKAEGKINENRLDGDWKVVGVYNGTYEEFAKDKDPDNNYESKCSDSFEQITINTKKEKFRPFHCSGEKEDWVKYKFKFGKNPQNKEKENYLKYNRDKTISIVDVTSKTMVIESELLLGNNFPKRRLYLLEKI